MQHLRSRIHTGQNVKCPWCPNKFVNLTGVCLHLESGACTSGINRQKIDQYCREVDPNHVFTNKQIGWYTNQNESTSMATGASWDGSWYRCPLCQKGFGSLTGLNSHLSSPVHRQKIYHCPRCQKEFVALSALINHMENETCGAFNLGRNPGGFGFIKQLRLTH